MTQHAFSEVELVLVARHRTFALAKAHPRPDPSGVVRLVVHP